MPQHLLGPAEYISSLPSKGVREAFIDALNVWLVLPDHHVNQLKDIAQTLHNASLMYASLRPSRASLTPPGWTISKTPLPFAGENQPLIWFLARSKQ